MDQDVIYWKFNKIRLADWSDSGFAGINGSNERVKLGSVYWVKGQPFDWSKVNIFDQVKGPHLVDQPLDWPKLARQGP